LDAFEDELRSRKHVVGLGIVPADHEQPVSGRRGLGVGVYVRKKVPKNKLAANDLVPASLELKGPKGVVCVPTRFIEQSEVRLAPVGKEALR
jgi:hypothetical protein